MRRLLTVLFIVFSTSVFAQTYQYLGGPTVTNYSRGSLRVDSFFYLPNSLPVSSIIRSGALRYNPVDSSLKVWTGTQWVSTSAVSAGSSNYIQNQYASQQVANAWFDSVKVSRVNITDRLTASLTGQSWVHMPYQTNNNTANVGIHFSNLPLWDSRLGLTTDPTNVYWNAVNPAPPIGTGIGQNRNQGAASMSFFRWMFENAGDTNRVDYSQQLQLFYRYNFDSTLKTYDTATGTQEFWPQMPGYNSNVQYYTNGTNTQWRTGDFGNNSANYTATQGFFNDPGGSIHINNGNGIVQYFADLDLQRELTTRPKKIMGAAGISQVYTKWKFHQGTARQDSGNYVNKIISIHVVGDDGQTPINYAWATSKAIDLGASMVDTVAGLWIEPMWRVDNEVNNPFAVFQEGTYDMNIYAGKTWHTGTGATPDVSDRDTTTALVITKGRTWSDTLSSTYTTTAGLKVTGQTSSTPQALTDGATITWNLNSGTNASVTLGGNRTLAISNAVAGTYGTLVITQDGTGSRTITLPAGSKVIGGGAGAVTLTTSAAAIDILTFYYNGTNYFWNIGKNYN